MMGKSYTIGTLLKEWVIWIFASFKPKDHQVWVFGALRGQRYADNAKYFFEFVHHHTNIKAVWLSKNVDVVQMLTRQGYTAFLESSREGKYYASRAKVAVVTHRGAKSNISDLPFHRFSKKTLVVQLWHGIPLKKIAFDDTKFSFRYDEKSFYYKLRKRVQYFLFPFFRYIDRPNITIALSEESKKIFSRAFRIPEDTVFITGYPRNDNLFVQNVNRNDMRYAKQILYAPTFRGEVNSEFDLFLKNDIIQVVHFLKKRNIILHLRLHPFNRLSKKMENKLNETANIVLSTDGDIYETLGNYDMLITDYSSIFFDFLLTNKPIIFAPFDKDTYMRNEREFYYDYDVVTPGPKAKNWNEVLEFIDMYLDDTTLFEKERKLICNRFHSFQDAKSSQRVYDVIRSHIDG